MSGSRAGVLAKIERAREHAQQLRASIDDFLSATPFRVTAEEEVGTGDLVYRLRIREQPPVRLSLLLGDAVHNARTALDHLAWQLVLESGGTPSTTSFPILPDKSTFVAKATTRNYLGGVSGRVLALVEAMRPWHGGDEQLWRLHKLDIEDKHRLLITVGTAHRNFILTFRPHALDERADPELKLSTAWRPQDRQYPLQDGVEVFRVRKAARTGPNCFEEELTFDIAFLDPALGEDVPLMPTIPDLIDHVEFVCQPLLAIFSG